MQSTISLSSFSGLNTVKFSCLSWTWFSNLSDEVICVLLLPGLKGVLLHDVINNETAKVNNNIGIFMLAICRIFLLLVMLSIFLYFLNKPILLCPFLFSNFINSITKKYMFAIINF